MKQELIKKINKKYKNFHKQTIKNGVKFLTEVFFPKLKTNNRFNIFHIKAHIQSGKTDLIKFLATYLMFEHNHKSSYVCTLADLQLWIQNDTRLSGIMRVFKKHNLLEAIKKGGMGIVGNTIFIDENDYGVDKDAIMASFLKYILETEGIMLNIVFVGATGYSLQEAHQNGLEVNLFTAELDENYFGIEEILNSKNFYDIKNYKLEIMPYEIKKVHKEHKTGMCIIRVDDRLAKSADIQKAIVERQNSTEHNFIVRSVHTKHDDDDTTIKYQIDECCRDSINNFVVVFVVGALTAGYDFGDFKSSIHLVYEPSKKHASACQGLVGRVCGYRDSSDFIRPRVYANRIALQQYIDFYNNDEIVVLKDSSTHLDSKTYSRRLPSYDGEVIKNELYDRKDLDNWIKSCNLGRRDFTETKASKHTTNRKDFLDRFNQVSGQTHIEDIMNVHPAGSEPMKLISKTYHILIDDVVTNGMIIIKRGNENKTPKKEVKNSSTYNDIKDAELFEYGV